MRHKAKENMLQRLALMLQLHTELTPEMLVCDAQVLVRLQEQAIDLGTYIECVADRAQEIVSFLEEYCEQLYQTSLHPQSWEQDVHRLDQLLMAARDLVVDSAVVYQVVFMPYNAAMWDSMASVWEACMADARCECLVVSLPYYVFHAESGSWEFCYDGEKFPENVQVTHFTAYQIAKERPDLVYIHNPFDECNHVTRIHPDYFSSELKKYAGRLVYIPYYVTGGFVSDAYLQLPAYYFADDFIIQSRLCKEAFRGYPYYDKILPLGSPKLDHVMQACAKGGVMPTEWRMALEGKKCLMLNTSIGCFLHHGAIYLKKIRAVFEAVKDDPRIAIIWRPHPLLESTIASMRPQLAGAYRELCEYFAQARIGVLDHTSDVANTVALSDAYIGEESTSVINLFCVAGKPIFILDNFTLEDPDAESRRRFRIGDVVQTTDGCFLTTDACNGLFFTQNLEGEISFVGRPCGELQHYLWPDFLKLSVDETDGMRLLLAPAQSKEIFSYDLKSAAFERHLQLDLPENLQCRRFFSYRQKLFYLPVMTGAIVEVDRVTGACVYHDACIREWRAGSDQEWDTFDAACVGNMLWVCACYSNRMLRFDMDTGAYELIEVGTADCRFCGIAADERYIWLGEATNGAIYRMEIQTGDLMMYDAPHDLRMWEAFDGSCLAYQMLIDMGRYVMAIPQYAAGVVCLDKLTDQRDVVLREFLAPTALDAPGYTVGYFPAVGFCKRMDERHLWIRRQTDDMLAIYDVVDDRVVLYSPQFSADAFEKLAASPEAFEGRDHFHGFFCRESRLYTFGEFLEHLAEDCLSGVVERQIQFVQYMAENADGTCGQKIHACMMEKLLEQCVVHDV